MEAPAVDTVLVAVDGSEPAVEAGSLAIAIADRYDAELVALFVSSADEVEAVVAGESDASEISETAEAVLGDLEREADAHDVPVRTASAYGFSPHRKLVHPGSVILDAAEEFGADFLVIPRESLEDLPSNAVLGKASEYALLYASQPVLSV